MKITLIYPLLSRSRSIADENKQYWPPLGLAYIAAVLEKRGHSVQILDRDYILRKNKFDFDKCDRFTLDKITAFHTDIAGFSATTPNISDVNLFSKKIKKTSPKIMTVLGGPHCVGEPALTLELCKDIDLLVRGEGEMAMAEIADGNQLSNIGSLTYRTNNGAPISNQEMPLIESLDELPLPARHLLDMQYYTRPSRFISRNLSLRTTHLFTARGCPYGCYYCAGPLMGRRRLRYHSARRVLTEIKELIDKYAVEAVYFAEDMFLSDKKRAIEMANLFMANGLHKKIVWMAQVSTNAVDDELLSVMKSAGCIHVEYGFESGSQRVLDLMNKKTTVGRNKEVASLTKKKGLRFQGNFIVGYPGEREEDFNKTISFVKKTRPNNISLNLFMPLPGTEIYNKLKQHNNLLPCWDDLGNPEAPFVNYADIPRERFEKLYFDAKLKVILPINLFYFLKDNLRHPLRLSYIISTQFRSVISRAYKAMIGLHRIKKDRRDKDSGDKPGILFITYHSISYSIMESQGLSYIKAMAKKGAKFSLLTFETKDSLRSLKESPPELKGVFKWRHLNYHRQPRVLATLLDIFCGIFYTGFIIKRDRISVIHARGLIPAIIAFLPAKMFAVKFFFDTRGFLAEKYAGGGLLKKGGFLFRTMRGAEGFLAARCDYFTVETDKHAGIIRRQEIKIAAKMSVIPCCVDMNRFNYLAYPGRSREKAEGINLVYLGKIGTWYLLQEMFDFYKILSEELEGLRFSFLTQDDPQLLYSIAEKNQIPLNKILVKRPAPCEIPGLLADANIGIFFINPYKRYNSSPIKFGEYLASGLPVVVNSGIGDTDTITESEKVGVVVKRFSPDDYRNSSRELINLLKEKEQLRKRCRDAARKYLTLEDGAEKYLKIYQRLLNK